MNVTFLIGNGFDVNLGLKTRYKDFYKKYIASNKDLAPDSSVKKFSELIDPECKTWADFEMAFAENIFGNKNDVADILYDFSVKFSQHLSTECEKCSYENPEVTAQFKDFLINGYKLLEKRDRQIIRQLYDDKENVVIKFINFNYTNTVEKLCNQFKKNNSNSPVLRRYPYPNNNYLEQLGNELHIHGTLQDYIIIGIDSLSQIKDEQLKNDKRVSKYCVKDDINSDNGNPQIIKQYIETINNSNIIYAYGISFGESDRSRWDIVQKWLRTNNTHKLIIYKWEIDLKQYERAYPRKLLDAIENYKNEYLKLLGFNEDEYEKYYNQIFVLDSSDVLKIKLIENDSSENETDETSVDLAGV